MAVAGFVTEKGKNMLIKLRKNDQAYVDRSGFRYSIRVPEHREYDADFSNVEGARLYASDLIIQYHGELDDLIGE